MGLEILGFRVWGLEFRLMAARGNENANYYSGFRGLGLRVFRQYASYMEAWICIGFFWGRKGCT